MENMNPKPFNISRPRPLQTSDPVSANVSMK